MKAYSQRCLLPKVRSINYNFSFNLTHTPWRQFLLTFHSCDCWRCSSYGRITGIHLDVGRPLDNDCSPKHNQIIDANALSGNGLKNATPNTVLLHSTQALKKHIGLTSNTSEVQLAAAPFHCLSLCLSMKHKLYVVCCCFVYTGTISIKLNIAYNDDNPSRRLDNPPANGTCCVCVCVRARYTKQLIFVLLIPLPPSRKNVCP